MDLRDVWLPRGGPSRLTLRRLWVLIKALPADALTWREWHALQEKAKKPTVQAIRDRAAYWAAGGNQRNN